MFNRANRKVESKSITTLTKTFRAACTKAGCPGRIPQDLRQTAARNLVRAGVPERIAMQWTEHRTRSVFERYNIVSECDLVEAAQKLNLLQPVPPASNRDRHNCAQSTPIAVPAEGRVSDFLGKVGGAARI